MDRRTDRRFCHSWLEIITCASLFFVFIGCANGLMVVQSPNLVLSTFSAVPISWDANPLKFANVTGYLVLANQTDAFLRSYDQKFPIGPKPSIILASLYPGYTQPYVEQRLVTWATRYYPAAVVFFGEYVEGIYYENGKLDHLRMGYSTKEATFPVVQAPWSAWYSLKPFLLNGSLVNITVTDQGTNPWRSIRSSWWFPTWISIGVLWCLINIGLAARALTRHPCSKTLAVVVLWIEITSNILRIPFMLDPFGVWWLPIPIIHVFLTMSWPLHVISAVLVILFWHELVTSRNIQVKTGFLTSSKFPAVAVIVLVVFVEYVTSGLRAAGFSSVVLNINFAVYCIVLLICLGIYIYVYRLVLKFLSNFKRLRSKDNMLKRVSLRFLMSGFTFLVLIGIGIGTISRAYSQALGQSVLHFSLIVCINAGSTLAIIAFLERSRKIKTSTMSDTGPGVGQSDTLQARSQTPNV